MSKVLQNAMELAEQGIPVFPCLQDKRPACSKGFKAATVFPDDSLFGPDADLIGMPTGELSGYDVLDIDPRREGMEWWNAHRHRLPETRVQQTRSGGLHAYFKHVPGLRGLKDKLAPGVEVKGDGNYVIRWDASGLGFTNRAIGEWPDWLLTEIARHQAATRETPIGAAELAAPSVDALVRLLDAMPNPASTDYERYSGVALAVRGSLGGLIARGECTSEDEECIVSAWVRWAERWETSDGSDESAAWERKFAGADMALAGWRHLLRHAAELGVDIRPWQDEQAQEDFKEEDAAEAPYAGNPNWHAMLDVTEKGNPKSTIANALTALRHAPEWAGVPAYDEFSDRYLFLKAPPFPKAYLGPIKDHHGILTAEWLQRAGINVSSFVAFDALMTVAKEHGFHPVRQYLNILKWDGKPRINTWLIDHLGARDTNLNQAFGSKFLIAAVARVMQPGCQVDTILMLEGIQGLRKSTSLEALFGQEWFIDNLPALHDKDAVQLIQGIWCAELAEMTSLRRTDVENTKSFLSRRVDKFRPSYGRTRQEFPRQTVFAATLNPGGSGYLRDETGGRRFWPVACGLGWKPGRRVNMETLCEVRDQLWAEAKVRFERGEKWWLDRHELEQEQERAVEERYDSDALTDLVDEIVRGKTHTTTMELLEHPKLSGHVKDTSKITQMRFAGILRALGWRREAKWLDGKMRKIFLPPIDPVVVGEVESGGRVDKLL